MNKTLDQIVNHLEFLGYKVEITEPQKEGDKRVAVAMHSKNNNLVFLEMYPGFILFKVNLSTERKPYIEMDSVINNANRILNLARIYYDVEDEKAILRFEAVYTGEYSKELFGQFYIFFEDDQQRLYKADGFSKAFLKESSDK